MIGPLMMCVSVVVLLLGMVLGIVMGIREDFTLQPAHAHLNLVGGVLLFLFGLYYRLVPAAGASGQWRVRRDSRKGWSPDGGGAVWGPTGASLVYASRGSRSARCGETFQRSRRDTPTESTNGDTRLPPIGMIGSSH